MSNLPIAPPTTTYLPQTDPDPVPDPDPAHLEAPRLWGPAWSITTPSPIPDRLLASHKKTTYDADGGGRWQLTPGSCPDVVQTGWQPTQLAVAQATFVAADAGVSGMCNGFDPSTSLRHP